ncbi:MAG: c-type cytochrome [Pseudomonadota bacterium]
MSQDQKFFDLFSLIIGILVIFTVGVFVLSSGMGNATQGQFVRTEAEYQARVGENIRPLGTVQLPGDAPVETAGAAAAGPEPAATVMSGPQVYNAACIACHGAGVAGAPAYGVAEQWSARIARGNDVLYDHAINGYMGEAGYMPAKGGRTDLSDDEVRAAVDYILAGSQ